MLKNTVATKRKFKDKATQNYLSDFIPIIAFGKTAEFIAEKFVKGQGIQVEAHLQSGSYDNKEGNKVYTLDAIIESVEFLGKRNDAAAGGFGDELELQDDGDMPF